jgi:hypothetical protein
MSSDLVSSTVDLHRTDASAVCRILRPYLVAGGVATAIIDIGERKLYLERTHDAVRQAKIRQEQLELSNVTDPVVAVMENDLIELNTSGMSLKEVMFECLHTAARAGAVVAFWACGNLENVMTLGDFDRPLMRNEIVVAGAKLVQSDQLRSGDLVACLASTQDALPIEVEKGLLVRLEDLRVETTDHPDLLRGYSERRVDFDDDPGTDHAGPTPPSWFGPAPT